MNAGGLVLALLANAPDGGAPDVRPRVRIEYVRSQDAAGCPEEPAVRSNIAARLGYDPFDPAAPRTVLLLLSREGEELRAEMKLVGPDGALAGERVLTSPVGSCAELAASMDLAVAIAIDPLVTMRPVVEPAPPPELPRPAPVAIEASPPPVAPTPRPSFPVRIGAMGSLGAAPGPTFGIVAGAGVQQAWWSVDIELRVDLPAAARVAGASEVESSQLSGTALGCLRRAGFGACVLATFGVLASRGPLCHAARRRTRSVRWKSMAGNSRQASWSRSGKRSSYRRSRSPAGWTRPARAPRRSARATLEVCCSRWWTWRCGRFMAVLALLSERGVRLGAAVVAVATAACEIRESVGDLPDSGAPPIGADGGCVPRSCSQLGTSCGAASDGCGGTLQCGACTPPQTCGGGGMAGACGIDSCGGCFSPPQGECWLSLLPTGSYTATTYKSPGACDVFNRCRYERQEQECPEDCTLGICHRGDTCTLDSLCKPALGCKWESASELRCKQVDDKRENQVCDESRLGWRCASHFVCVRPPSSAASVCAYLCRGGDDCFGRGIESQGWCVIDGTLGTYGWCR